jgi:hypothetical protein
MASNINATDSYTNPFEWSGAYPHEAPEDCLFGLLPCPWQCEYGGWLPLVNGGLISCPSCNPTE